LPKTKSKFRISGGYNNQETSFKLHIDLSDMSQKEMIKAFVKKAICELVEKNLDHTKTKDKKEHLKKLFHYYYLDDKLELKSTNHTTLTTFLFDIFIYTLFFFCFKFFEYLILII
jgi:oligoribonuclease NrnB/cAMP/cGMP phosphodiesterase (DHH superfamily)